MCCSENISIFAFGQMKRLIISLASTMMFKDDLNRIGVFQYTNNEIDRAGNIVQIIQHFKSSVPKKI